MSEIKTFLKISDMGEPCKFLSSHDLKPELVFVRMEIPKTESDIELFSWYTGEKITYDEWRALGKLTLWTFSWERLSSLFVSEVIDSPESDSYLIKVILMDNMDLSNYKDVLRIRNKWSSFSDIEVYQYK